MENSDLLIETWCLHYSKWLTQPGNSKHPCRNHPFLSRHGHFSGWFHGESVKADLDSTLKSKWFTSAFLTGLHGFSSFSSLLSSSYCAMASPYTELSSHRVKAAEPLVWSWPRLTPAEQPGFWVMLGCPLHPISPVRKTRWLEDPSNCPAKKITICLAYFKPEYVKCLEFILYLFCGKLEVLEIWKILQNSWLIYSIFNKMW